MSNLGRRLCSRTPRHVRSRPAPIFSAVRFSTAEKDPPKTHFGFSEVNESAKEGMVGEVFHNVARNYDIMNDLMSGGLHRLWKDHFVSGLKPLHVSGTRARPVNILDVAGGTGDVAFRLVEAARAPAGSPIAADRKEDPNTENECASKRRPCSSVTVLDINSSMLSVGEERAVEKGFTSDDLSWVEASAEELPFDDNSFDVYTIAFGIRNVTHVDKALREARRVLKPGGRFSCLEFSRVSLPLIRQAYDAYSFAVIPALGQAVAGDHDSYKVRANRSSPLCRHGGQKQTKRKRD